MKSEGDPFLRATPVDLGKDAACRVARNITGTQQFCEVHCPLDVVAVFEGGRVVRNASDSRPVQFFHCGTEQTGVWLTKEHKLSARHFDFLDAKDAELDNHIVYGEIVITIRANADVEFTRSTQGRDRQAHGAGYRFNKPSSADH